MNATKGPVEITCRRFVLSPQARKLLTPDLECEAFLTRLVNARLTGDAIQFLAYRLAKREAVWWGCLAVRHANMLTLPPAEEAALDAVVRWVVEPSEEHRRATELSSDTVVSATPAGYVARACFFSGGNTNPPGLPPAEPSENVTPRMIAGAMFLIASPGEPASERPPLDRLLAMGIGVIKKRIRWD